VAHALLPRPVRYALVVDAGLGLVATAIGAGVTGWSGAASVACGFAIVIAFFTASAASVLAAERVSVHLTLPVALTVYLTALGLLALLIDAVGDHGLLRRLPVAGATLAAVLVWLGVQLAATVRAAGAQ
jgi:hypothetical protein